MEELNNLAGELCNSDTSREELLDVEPFFKSLQELLSQFYQAHSHLNKHKLWETFLEMTGILLRFIQAQRDGSWLDYLQEIRRMLPFIVAAGHYKYGICVPLYLKDMNELQANAPDVYQQYFDHGDFTIC